MATRKENPVGGSSGKSKRGKIGEDDNDGTLVEVEGMPAWAKEQMNILMKHTTDQVSGLHSEIMVEVDAAKAMAMEACEEVRALKQELALYKEKNRSSRYYHRHCAV